MKSLNFSYLSRLDHLRFYAIFLVMMFHLRGDILSSLSNDSSFYAIKKFFILLICGGNSGVSLFLVLSAFLFTLITHAGDKELIYSRFIYNRILRIFPLTIVLIFIIITCSRATSTPMDIFRLLTLQLNTGNPVTGWGDRYFISGVIWTIGVEFQFYLLFPLLIYLYKKHGVPYLIGLIVTFVIIKALISLTHPLSSSVYHNIYHTIIGRLSEFLIGMLLGIFYIKKRIYLSRLQCIIGIFSFLIVYAIVSKSSYDDVHKFANYFREIFYFEFEAIFWGFIILFYLRFPDPKNQLSEILGKILSYLGNLTFSLYLLHLSIAYAVYKIFNIGVPQNLSQFFGYLSLQLLFIVPICILSFNIIEKPFLSLRTRYFKESSLKPSANALH